MLGSASATTSCKTPKCRSLWRLVNKLVKDVHRSFHDAVRRKLGLTDGCSKLFLLSSLNFWVPSLDVPEGGSPIKLRRKNVLGRDNRWASATFSQHTADLQYELVVNLFLTVSGFARDPGLGIISACITIQQDDGCRNRLVAPLGCGRSFSTLGALSADTIRTE